MLRNDFMGTRQFCVDGRPPVERLLVRVLSCGFVVVVAGTPHVVAAKTEQDRRSGRGRGVGPCMERRWPT